LLAAALVLAACGGVDGPGAPGADAGMPSAPGVPDGAVDAGTSCADRRGGALVGLEVDTASPEAISVWITRGVFIDEATRLAGRPKARIPCFLVIAAAGCDPRWSFTVDAEDASFEDTTVEIYDATPSYVNAHLREFTAPRMRWCPWAARVVAVDDRRPR